jgi:MFS transporter, DHA3 family, tetracycline resistance protein
MTRLKPYTIYLILSGAGPFLGTTIWVVGTVYYVLSVHMNPLQLVLVGTALEVSYFVFQVPTGVFADTYGRRLSIVIGTLMVGACWVFQGLIPLFVAIIAAELVRGLAEAFVDGAESAWLSDELGEDQFGKAMLRGSQVGQVTGIVGTFAGVALASIRLNLPIVAGGACIVGLGIFLALAMPERNFKPAPRQEISRRQVMTHTLRSGVWLVRGSALLLAILAIGILFGAFSEGFDRLWQAHVLHNFTFPRLDHLKPVVWFGIINAAVGILNIGAAEILRRRVDITDHVAVPRALFAVNALLVAGVVVFGLAGSFALAVATFLTARVMRTMNGSLYTAWLNQNITDSSVRATVLSMCGQADALGQFVGGPIVGVIGTVFSLRAALTTAGAILSPALLLYAWVLRRGDQPIVPQAQEELQTLPSHGG